MTTKYRIKWKSSRMKMEGRGKPVFQTHDEASLIADRLNARHKGTVVYWVDVEVEEETPCNPAD